MVVGPFLVSLKKLKCFLFKKLSWPTGYFSIANISIGRFQPINI